MSDGDDPKPTPLEYQKPDPRRPLFENVVLVAGAGFAVVWSLLTAVECGSGSLPLMGPTPVRSWTLPAVTAVALVAAAGVIVSNLRTPRRRAEVGLGLLLGVGLALCVHGYCFVSANFG